MVIDAPFAGRLRKLLVQANRNGFFYVLDRSTGRPLLARQFVDELTWARGIDADGRPQVVTGQEPSEAGTRVCPSQAGATNWYSPSYSPATGLFDCGRQNGVRFTASAPMNLGRQAHARWGDYDCRRTWPVKILRALDISSGAVRWNLRQVGTSNTSGGTLATASGLVIFGDDSGALAAADAATGKRLWLSQTGASWRASPMAYEFDGEEMIAVAAGGNIIALALTAE